MSLRLFLDEDSQARMLIQLLRDAGHDISCARDAGLGGQTDERVLLHAKREQRVLLTRNCGDFQTLHRADPEHPGILAVYEDADRSKNMSYAMIVRAIGNLEAAGQVLTGQFVVLNRWSY